MAKNKKDNQPGQKKTDKTNGVEGQLRTENKKNEPSAESKKRGNELDF